jgi:uncharacterized repeat protein (TIGR03803 family)
MTVLHSFRFLGADGEGPNAFIQATDGNFYGTTAGGTVFRMTPDGTVTVLHAFARGSPSGGLVAVPDGNFYGTTSYSGSLDFGTVFRVAPDGAYTTLNQFAGARAEAAAAQKAGDQFTQRLTDGFVTWLGGSPDVLRQHEDDDDRRRKAIVDQ